ncbi:MAG: hypothetical protein ACRDRT_11680, partial [Pseudonocardiaceae bacterium]
MAVTDVDPAVLAEVAERAKRTLDFVACSDSTPAWAMVTRMVGTRWGIHRNGAGLLAHEPHSRRLSLLSETPRRDSCHLVSNIGSCCGRPSADLLHR